MKHLFLVRHGESEANVGLPTSDPVKVSLTRKGEVQAFQLNKVLPFPQIVFHSTFARSKQTAETFLYYADKLQRYFTPAKVEEVPIQEFTYLSTEDLENTTQIQRLPATNTYWETADPFLKNSGVWTESFAEFMQRVEEFWMNLSNYGESTAIAFTHGHFMRAILWTQFFKFAYDSSDAMKRFRLFTQTFPIDNTAIISINFTDKVPSFSFLGTPHLFI